MEAVCCCFSSLRSACDLVEEVNFWVLHFLFSIARHPMSFALLHILPLSLNLPLIEMFFKMIDQRFNLELLALALPLVPAQCQFSSQQSLEAEAPHSRMSRPGVSTLIWLCPFFVAHRSLSPVYQMEIHEKLAAQTE